MQGEQRLLVRGNSYSRKKVQSVFHDMTSAVVLYTLPLAYRGPRRCKELEVYQRRAIRLSLSILSTSRVAHLLHFALLSRADSRAPPSAAEYRPFLRRNGQLSVPKGHPATKREVFVHVIHYSETTDLAQRLEPGLP